jgi:hypothetical protein
MLKISLNLMILAHCRIESEMRSLITYLLLRHGNRRVTYCMHLVGIWEENAGEISGLRIGDFSHHFQA